MPSYKETCSDFLGSPGSTGRSKLPKTKIGKELSDEDKRPDAWVCQEQDPNFTSPAAKRRSWKPKRVINQAGLLDAPFGE